MPTPSAENQVEEVFNAAEPDEFTRDPVEIVESMHATLIKNESLNG